MRVKSQSFQSRQTMKGETFEIFSYKEPRKDVIPLHHHDFYEVYFYLSGNVQFMVESRTFSLQPGDILLVSPSELHRAVVSPDASDERIVLWIDRRFLQGLHEPGENLTACFEKGLNLLRPSPIERANVLNIANELVSEYYGADYCSELAALALFIRLMVEINRIAAAKTYAGADNRGAHELAGRILSYIGEHYAEDISLDSLSAKFFVSKYHLSHEFSAAVGTSIHKYVVMKRLVSARQLILDGMSPGEACHECGYRDYSNFYRAYLAYYGTNPGALETQV